MTQASFYKKESSGIPATQGIYFEIPEQDLAKEIQRKKNEQSSQMRKADKIINSNHEIKELKQKIQQAYLHK